jgi:bacterioferritin
LPVLREGTARCKTAHDFVTGDLFSEILEVEEHYVDLVKTQLGFIPKVGVENYIQLQSEHAE